MIIQEEEIMNLYQQLAWVSRAAKCLIFETDDPVKRSVYRGIRAHCEQIRVNLTGDVLSALETKIALLKARDKEEEQANVDNL